MKILTSNRQAGITTTVLLLLITIVALLGAVYMLFGSMQDQRAIRLQLAAQETELIALRDTAEEVERLTVQNAQLHQLKEDSKELIQLRAEVAALRPAQQQFEKLKLESHQLKAQLGQMKQAAGDATTLRTQNDVLKTAITQRDETGQQLACIANLKQIEAAKNAWAEDNSKRPIDIPLDTELFGPQGYLPQKPECPTKGTYTPGSVETKPTCTVPGHQF